MGNPTGFLRINREEPKRRPISERILDFDELEGKFGTDTLRTQASRCMDCGVPFCHTTSGCPLGNLIPEWNDLVYRGRMHDAITRLHATNNFPEFTGRVCPAPCESACVLSVPSVGTQPVTIKQIEKQIIDHAFHEGWITAQPPAHKNGKKVAVIGSGPAGLACAQQLARAGFSVTVFERDDRIGGLLRYGIPDFKLEKMLIDRRLEQMRDEGVVFKTNVSVGHDLDVSSLKRDFDDVVIAVGACAARESSVPGRELPGVHLAMDFLARQNKVVAGDAQPLIDAKGKRVVILGGGDTGSDCLGTSLRQGASSVQQLELLPRPKDQRGNDNPWPQWPLVFRTSSSQEEGGGRSYAVLTKRFIGEGKLEAIETVQVAWQKERERWVMNEVAGTEARIECDLVLLAMGFTGVEQAPWLKELGVEYDARGNVIRTPDHVEACGDAEKGASLVVWAIASGRQAAARIIAGYEASRT
jgi:glutamate synthase (NADPH) small chain